MNIGMLTSVLLVLAGQQSFASETLTFEGTDSFVGEACSVQYTFDEARSMISEVVVEGQSETYEILAETGDSYGPDTRIEFLTQEIPLDIEVKEYGFLPRQLKGFDFGGSASASTDGLTGKYEVGIIGTSPLTPQEVSVTFSGKAFSLITLAKSETRCTDLQRVQ